MIGYHGWKGEGKTLKLVADLQRLHKKSPEYLVFSNTPFLISDMDSFYLWKSQKELKTLFSSIILSPYERPIIVVIDEIHLEMPSRNWKSSADWLLSFLAQARHLKCEIYFTTQHPARPDKIVRELTEEWVMVKAWPSKRLRLFTTSRRQVLDIDGKSVMWEQTFLNCEFLSKYYTQYFTHYNIKFDLAELSEDHISKVLDFLEKNRVDYVPDRLKLPDPKLVKWLLKECPDDAYLQVLKKDSEYMDQFTD